MNSGSNSTFNQFNTTNKYVSSTQEFLESNSLVAQVAFLLLVLILFVFLLRLGISILGYYFSPSDSPKIINGMVDAKQLIVIPQDPSIEGSIPISRSVNASDGIEFTWSTWIYIDDLTYNSGKYKCVFYKGNDFSSDPNDTDAKGLNFPNNAPGVYIAPNTNDLIIFMNTFNVINEQITINDIPLNKWVNVIIRCQNNTLDVYINGTIVKSHHLHGVPKQNYGDLYIAPNGGFAGYISNLWYYNYGLGTSAISNIVRKGPNTKMKGSNGINMKNNNYLSLRWYFYGSQDEFNP
uniref:LamG-like jellyroll fold domain-containing protein n=1 Tax=viral metagenome TaxID=1070528 RepID=A0A6C0KQJ7_9ZZZZ